MNVSHQNTDNLNAVISIEISKADYQEKVDKSLRAYGQKANIPGFRKGKVPFSMLMKMFGKSVRVEEINRLVSESLYNYIRDNKLNILGEPMTAEDIVDCGDNVIIINADKVKLTGNKWNDRVYLSYTGYPGGQREMTPARLITKPNGEERLLKKVVKGMLPKNILGAKLLNNLYVYAGSEHKQAAQNPKMIDINSYK